MKVTSVAEARLVEMLEQTARQEPPTAWQAFAPNDKHLRGGSRLVLKIAELTAPSEMSAELRRVAETVEANRASRRKKGKEGKEKNEDRDGEDWLWREMADALDRLADVEEGKETSDLAALRLWVDWPAWQGLPSPLREIGDRPLELPPVDDRLLARIARVLLRERAHRWSEKARAAESEKDEPDERPGGEGSEER